MPRAKNNFQGHRARWYDEAGTQREKRGFKTKRDAEKYKHEQLALVERNKRTKPSDVKMTLRQFIVEVYAPTLAVQESTKLDYELQINNYILPAFGSKVLLRIQPADIEAWLNNLQVGFDGRPPLSANTAKKVTNIYSMILKKAVQNDYIDRNPFDVVTRKKSRRVNKVVPYTKERAHELINAMSEKYQLVIWLCYYAGLRPSEALGLTYDRLNWSEGTITIDRQLSRSSVMVFAPHLKTKKAYRVIGFPKALQIIIKKHVDTYGLGPEGLLLSNRYGGVWRYKDARTMYSKIARLQGVAKGHGLHQFRHTCVSNLIRQGAQPKDIQDFVGHESIIETMDTYGHLFPDSKFKIADFIDAIADESSDQVTIYAAG